jgi:hypothetical protein
MFVASDACDHSGTGGVHLVVVPFGEEASDIYPRSISWVR